MKKLLIISALFLSIAAFSQESAATYKTRIKATRISESTPDWFWIRAYSLIDWTESRVGYAIDNTDTTAAKVLTRTIAGPLYLENGDTVATKILTRKLADPLYLNESDFDSLVVKGEKSSLADDGTITLPSAKTGMVWVVADSAGIVDEYMCVVISSDGSVILTPNVSTNIDDADTDTKLCVYDGGTSAVIKNRLGSRRTIKVIYIY